ncbi:MAG: helix-turn-helix domain-containing protein [Dehalococcoidia bacterium]
MKSEKMTLNVEEAAKLLGISRNLAYQLAREGKLPTIRFGRRMLVPCRALERMLDVDLYREEKSNVEN